MGRPYSQSRALWAITRASFKAIFAQPVAIFFSLMFPIIFIFIFGSFGNRTAPVYRVAIDPRSDTTNPFFTALKSYPPIRIARYADTAAMHKDLVKGDLSAVLTIRYDSLQQFPINVRMRSTSASEGSLQAMQQSLDYFKLKFESMVPGNHKTVVQLEEPVITEGKRYKQIDFVLPGQIGFSILFSTLFGIAFTFYTLREQLVLKRFYASPVKKLHILTGIGVSRLFFQILNVIVLILFGHFVFNFRLEHGAVTVIELVILTIVMLFLLMGVGLIFSSVAKSDASIPIWINLFGFPQMLLSGTFFPITVFPKWLQEFCNILPLTHFNNATRKICFDGLHLVDVWKELGVMAIWIVVTYVILARVIRWE
jgi:ABC-2 type transport system permease protein